MNIKSLQSALEVFESIKKSADSLTSQEEALQNLQNIDPEVRSLVKKLIKNQNVDNHSFNQLVSQHIQRNHIDNKIIDEYELTEFIGEGGMSSVFKGHRIGSTDSKPVAIKIFKSLQHSDQLKDRFIIEQQILAQLDHPNIIRLHHTGTTKYNEPYIVMELIEDATPIDQYIKEKRLAPKAIIGLFVQLNDAIAHAHKHLIVHRDIKPKNVIINKHGQVKVLDFGIAKLINDELTIDEDTMMLMTPEFAAPEQINGEAITVATDIYSLGALSATVLTGQRLFNKERLRRDAHDNDIYLEQLLKNSDLVSDLKNILNKALKTKPEQRYSSVNAMTSDWQAWLDNKPVTATKNTWLYRLNRFIKRRTAVFLSLCALVVVTILSLVTMSIKNQQIVTENLKAQAVKQFMLDSFAVSNPNNNQGQVINVKELLEVAAFRLNNNSDITPAIKIELQLALATALGQIGEVSKAIKMAERAVLHDLTNEQGMALLAQLYLRSGKTEQLEKLFNKLSIQEIKSDSERYSLTRTKAHFLATKGIYQQGIDLLKENKEINKNQLEQSKDLQKLSTIYFLMGKADSAVKTVEQAIRLNPLPDTHTYSIQLKINLISYLDQLGQFKQAVELIDDNIAQFEKILGKRHPDLGDTLNLKSVFQRIQGKLIEARKTAIEALEIFQSLYGSDNNYGSAQAYGGLGIIDYLENKNVEAISNLSKAVDILSTVHGTDHLETLDAKANLATVLNAAGESEKALELLFSIYAKEKEILGISHRSTLLTSQSLALSLANLNRHEEAIKIARETLNLSTKHFKDDHPMRVNTNIILGKILFQAGHYYDALLAFKEAEQLWNQEDDYLLNQLFEHLTETNKVLGNVSEVKHYYQKRLDLLELMYGKESAEWNELYSEQKQWSAQSSP